MENVTVSDLIALLDKPENRRTDRGTERLIQLDVNGESIGYITSAKLDGWGSGLIAELVIGSYRFSHREGKEQYGRTVEHI